MRIIATGVEEVHFGGNAKYTALTFEHEDDKQRCHRDCTNDVYSANAYVRLATVVSSDKWSHDVQNGGRYCAIKNPLNGDEGWLPEPQLGEHNEDCRRQVLTKLPYIHRKPKKPKETYPWSYNKLGRTINHQKL